MFDTSRCRSLFSFNAAQRHNGKNLQPRGFPDPLSGLLAPRGRLEQGVEQAGSLRADFHWTHSSRNSEVPPGLGIYGLRLNVSKDTRSVASLASNSDVARLTSLLGHPPDSTRLFARNCCKVGQ